MEYSVPDAGAYHPLTQSTGTSALPANFTTYKWQISICTIAASPAATLSLPLTNHRSLLGTTSKNSSLHLLLLLLFSEPLLPTLPCHQLLSTPHTSPLSSFTLLPPALSQHLQRSDNDSTITLISQHQVGPRTTRPLPPASSRHFRRKDRESRIARLSPSSPISRSASSTPRERELPPETAAVR